MYGSKLNYFSLFLCSIILTEAIFGEESINADCFIDELKQYVWAEDEICLI